MNESKNSKLNEKEPVEQLELDPDQDSTTPEQIKVSLKSIVKVSNI